MNYVSNAGTVLSAFTAHYGVAVGNSYSSSSTLPLNSHTFGVTTDASKSGIICEADSNIVLVIKF